MKILSSQIFRKILVPTIVSGTLFCAYSQTKNQNNILNSLEQDIFMLQEKVPTKGTTSQAVLQKAPNPEVYIKGKKNFASIVVDLAQNVLYEYKNGKPISAYLIASGKKSTPTDTGLRIVTHIETYPYKSAPKSTKRYKNPNDYGPRIICLEKLDSITGIRSVTGEFIHGNNNPQSLGKYVSKGCMRMDNEVIKLLAQKVKRGALVLIKR